MTIFTIGYGNKPIDEFIAKLKEFGISLVVDVRSRPFSRWNSKFSQKPLETELARHSINYLFKGNNLGGLDENINLEGAIDEVVKLSSSLGLVVMCSESQPEKCHRFQTLTPAFESRGAQIVHIRWEKPVVLRLL